MSRRRAYATLVIGLVLLMIGLFWYLLTVTKKHTLYRSNINANVQNDKLITTVSQDKSASSTIPATPSNNTLHGLSDIYLPKYCTYHLSTDIEQVSPSSWIIDCGKETDNDARSFMKTILRDQNWTLCSSGLAGSYWQKEGVITIVTESTSGGADQSYPFLLQQEKSSGCDI